VSCRDPVSRRPARIFLVLFAVLVTITFALAWISGWRR
jgi:hypothetical protein